MIRLKELRKQEKMSQADLAKALHTDQTAVSKWETGGRKLNTLQANEIAVFFDVSVDYLLGNTQQKKTPTKGVKIPVLGKIIAGVPMEAITDILDYEEIDPDLAKTGEFFALQVKGDSMTPKIDEGDVVIVRKQSDVENGQLAVIIINGDEATLKKVIKKEDGIVLKATNPVAYSPQFYSWQEIEELPVTILGRVIELRAKF